VNVRPFLVAVGIVVLAGCSTSGSTAPDAEMTGTMSGSVTVLAAASLSGPLDEAAAAFTNSHPEIDIVISYGGSSALAQQIVEGSPADVFFSANETTMQTVVDAGLAVDPTVVLTNTLEIAVPAGNPAGISGLDDFARPGLEIALCDPAVPCGSAAVELLDLVGVTASVDTLEEDVRATLAKVALGEVDAALVYRTDVLAAGDAVEGIEVPEATQVINRYPIALLADAPNSSAARAFMDFLLSSGGTDVFTAAGFGTT
jgi:molybdate transport system substrate-binding protein